MKFFSEVKKFRENITAKRITIMFFVALDELSASVNGIGWIIP